MGTGIERLTNDRAAGLVTGQPSGRYQTKKAENRNYEALRRGPQIA
jgi:hypothetical protein